MCLIKFRSFVRSVVQLVNLSAVGRSVIRYSRSFSVCVTQLTAGGGCG